MAVQISHSIYTEIPEAAAIWSSEEASWRGVSPIGKAKRMLDRRRACHAGSRAHVDQCAAEIGGIERSGIHQGQECDSRGEALFEQRAKLRWAADLGPRFLR
jgi:hypothetical protein